MNRFKLLALVLVMASQTVGAQRVLTLQECRDLAIENNKQSLIAREKVNAADYDKKAAFANYLPKVSATGAYLHNSDNLQLLSSDKLTSLSTIGTQASTSLAQMLNGYLSDPTFLQLLQSDATLQYFMAKLAGTDMGQKLDAIGQSIADEFTLDIENVYVGVVTVQEPIFAGGKIHAYNKVTAYAKELAESQLATEDRNVMVTTDAAYWQIVSIASKLKLTQNYVELLRKLDSDVEKMKQEGLATVSDQLAVRVKLNEAEMALIKATNGLALSKMLLCQICGLDLHTEIMLQDESTPELVVPAERLVYTEEQIEANRPELNSLRLAAKMYNEKVNIVRADYLPTIALMGNYLISNPSAKDGFQNKWNSTWNVGVVATIPVFHFGEGYNKVRRAKSDALIAQYQYDETREKISLQATQYDQRISEAESRLEMALKSMENAEENLRMANLSFQEGVVESSTVLAAQTAWMQAHSEETDARIDLIMAHSYLRQATGLMK